MAVGVSERGRQERRGMAVSAYAIHDRSWVSRHFCHLACPELAVYSKFVLHLNWVSLRTSSPERLSLFFRESDNVA